MRHILTTRAAATARSSGFVQRRSKLTGPLFAQTLVFGWWSHPAALLEDLVLTADALGCDLSPQALDQRFSPAAATFLFGLLQDTVAVLVTADPAPLPLLRRFSAVLIADGSTITLPPALQDRWRGCGTAHGSSAALKLLVELDLLGGALHGPLVVAGRTHDRTAAAPFPPPPSGSLCVRDLGFFSLADFAARSASGSYWLSRLRCGTTVYTAAGVPLHLRAWLTRQTAERGERAVLVGAEQRLAARLLYERVPEAIKTERQAAVIAEAGRRQRAVNAEELLLCAWTVLITNAPGELLSVGEALVLARARWQIELLWKRWKSLGQVDEWRTRNPERIVCEIYAKLIGLIMQYWLVVVGSWAQVDRSLRKGMRVLQSYGGRIAGAWTEEARLEVVLTKAARTLGRRCRINRQAQEPATYQLLLNPELLAVKYAAQLKQGA
jgi:hypothetical protein